MAEQIIQRDLGEITGQSFVDYALSVITDRALPDIRDGLKPVQRRILYSMYDQNMNPSGRTYKCATTVGNVLGSYHPHGILM